VSWPSTTDANAWVEAVLCLGCRQQPPYAQFAIRAWDEVRAMLERDERDEHPGGDVAAARGDHELGVLR